ncbi:unnamed protein product, partial [marine sediment metagenome]
MMDPSVNVILTYVCPNKCRYCFAPNYISSQKNIRFMSLHNFRLITNFLKKSNLTNIRLLGGEPLIHPNIDQILDEIEQDDFFEIISIFTSGVFPSSLVERLNNEKIILVINLNHQKDYSRDNYNRFMKNIEKMSNKGIR